MNLPDPEASVPDHDGQLRERIRAEVKALLNQQRDLAHLEKTAMMQEKLMRVSHDIRNPLTTIQAVCSALILEMEDSEQIQRLQMISKLVDQLSAMLTGAVDQGRDHHDVMTLIDLTEMLHSMVNLLQYQSYGDIDIRLDLTPNLCCTLPPRAFSSSLYQLLYNALEATRHRHPGEVRVKCRNEADELQIHILDNGPGLPRELLETGLRAYASAHPGAALGLSSVERFASSLGGRLELKNHDTGGAWVSLLLPVECPECEGWKQA